MRADVTPEIRDAARAARRGAASGRPEQGWTVTVANVQAGQGYNRHGGWTLLVAWETDAGAWRNLTLYDGFAYVQVEGGQQKVVGPLEFTGFRTPVGGNVDAHAATWTYEGDRVDHRRLPRARRLGQGLRHADAHERHPEPRRQLLQRHDLH